nr:unnamed protein product [Callosobruchus analis]CAI5831235.1 unnamed protein product [Callosobruchus analis]CAI5838913.1 unnamed protein product [Callosobruchus analis]CAI5840512.1 unnamed protein product [Callosobruchus analis]CAI5841432.1 unnamed protein product [Callosobruchus analis]
MGTLTCMNFIKLQWSCINTPHSISQRKSSR